MPKQLSHLRQDLVVTNVFLGDSPAIFIDIFFFLHFLFLQLGFIIGHKYSGGERGQRMHGHMYGWKRGYTFVCINLRYKTWTKKRAIIGLRTP